MERRPQFEEALSRPESTKWLGDCCSSVPLQERQRLLIEFGDILIKGRVRTPLKDEKLRIADAALQSIRKTRRRQLIVAPECDLRRRTDSLELRFHVVSENGVRLLDEVRH